MSAFGGRFPPIDATLYLKRKRWRFSDGRSSTQSGARICRRAKRLASMALTKVDMAEGLFNEIGLNKKEARELVHFFFQELEASLAVGEQVKLSGFGNFDLRDKNERPGRNPKTGEEIPIPARRVVTFRAGQKLRARVEAYAGTGE